MATNKSERLTRFPQRNPFLYKKINKQHNRQHRPREFLAPRATRNVSNKSHETKPEFSRTPQRIGMNSKRVAGQSVNFFSLHRTDNFVMNKNLEARARRTPHSAPSVRSGRQRRAARSANQRAERTVGARGLTTRSHLAHLLRVRPARATLIPPRSNRLRARRLSSLCTSAYGTHTSISPRIHHANENPLISDRSPWQRSICTVNMVSCVAAITVRPLFHDARGYLRAVGH